MLEGGYSLEALEVSSESVFKTLLLDPRDEEGFNKLLASYDVDETKNTYEKLAIEALKYPRYSFRLTMCALSKLLKKTWGKVVEENIFEIPRRKSTGGSKKSSNSGSAIRPRFSSMDGQNELIDGLQESSPEEKEKARAKHIENLI